MPTESETSKKEYVKTRLSDNICTDVNGNNLEVHFGEQFSYLQALTTNSLINNIARGPKFYCYQCNYFLHTQLSMITHMKMHRKPFCPICFEVFEDDEGLTVHSELHLPILYPNISFPFGAGALDGVLKEEDAFHQTGAPPNSPNHESCVPSPKECAPDNDSLHFLLAEKLRRHQNMLNFSVRRSNDGSSIRKKTSNGRSHKGKRTSIIGVSGKVHKHTTPRASRAKSTASPRNEPGDLSENVLKRITSRFGRAISLKVPQY